jgi:hypothetical protein
VREKLREKLGEKRGDQPAPMNSTPYNQSGTKLRENVFEDHHI